MVLVSPWAVVTKVTWMGTFFSPSEAPAIPLIKMLAWTLPVADWTDITAVAAPLLESAEKLGQLNTIVLSPFQKGRYALAQYTVTRSHGSFLQMTTRRPVSTMGLRQVSCAKSHGR